MILKSFLSSGFPLSFPDCDVFLTNRGTFLEYPVVTDLNENFYYWRQGGSMRVSVIPRESRFFTFAFNKFLRFYFKVDDISSLNLSSGEILIFNLLYNYAGGVNTTFSVSAFIQSATTFKFCVGSRFSKDSTLYYIYSDIFPLSDLYTFAYYSFSFDAGGNLIMRRNNSDITLTPSIFATGYTGFNGSVISVSQNALNPIVDYYYFYFGCNAPVIPNTHNFYYHSFEFGDIYSVSNNFVSQEEKISSLHSFVESNCKFNNDGSIDYTKAFKFTGSDGREFYLTEELIKYCNQFK